MFVLSLNDLGLTTFLDQALLVEKCEMTRNRIYQNCFDTAPVKASSVLSLKLSLRDKFTPGVTSLKSRGYAI